MPLLTFPAHLFNPGPVKAGLGKRTISGGESLSGDTDVIRTDGGGRWEVTFGQIELIDPVLVDAWNAWASFLEDGAQPCLVPLVATEQAPAPIAAGEYLPPAALVSASSDPSFPEATAFAEPWIIATCTAAALRATSLKITITQGSRCRGYFSINHPTVGRRAYHVERFDALTKLATIKPPLREAVANGTSLDFDWPSFTGQLVPGTDITPEVANGSATVSISFREAF